MVTTRQAYDETIVQNEKRNHQQLEARLRRQARELGLQLVAASRDLREFLKSYKGFLPRSIV
jgi:hypothetical protein